MSPLEAIAKEATAEPPELPRLTTAQVFLHHQRLGRAIQIIAHRYGELLDATPQACSESLKDLVKQAEVLSQTALRLIEANR